MNTQCQSMWASVCQSKFIEPNEITEKVNKLRSSRQTIATLNGSFDLMHAGHLQIIFEASLMADVLIVALNTDLSIQQYKGNNRPLIPLQYRLQMMAALEFVDYVTWFDETDPCQLLNKIKSDVHVNGSEYGEHCIEAETVKANGGRLHIVSRIPGLATSDIIRKIQKDF